MTTTTVKATTADGQQLEFQASDLKYSLGQAIDEETFKNRYANQGLNKPPNVIRMQDLNRLKLQYRLQQLANARKGPGSATAPPSVSK